MRYLLSISIGLLCVVQAGMAQPNRTVIDVRTDRLQQLATFDQARALGVAPSGPLFVADAGRDVVVQLDRRGRVTEVLGGPGIDPGEFDTPTDVDPTNGLVLLVADAGNSRIQRFSRGLRLLEEIPIGTEARRPRSRYDRARDALQAPADGRPVAVVTTQADEVIVLDAARNIVVKWERNRRAQRVLGGFDSGPQALIEPFALALGANDELLVADRGRNAIIVFDAFGTFLRPLARGAVEDAANIAVIDREVWVVQPRQIWVYDERGRPLRRVRFDLQAPLVDVARQGSDFLLLTEQRLYRWSP